MRLLKICSIVMLLLLPAAAQDREKRLILKDGSYEMISEYSIVGDRVRYFSSERNSWEELPSSMIDWEATDKYAQQASLQAAQRREKALQRARAARSEEEARSPVLAPGVQLPSSGGTFLLDTFQDIPVLIRLAQNGADLKKNTGSNILRGVINPIAGPRQTVELEGLHAEVQSRSLSPSIYFWVDPADPEAEYNSTNAADHLRIVQCEEKKGNRVVLTVDIAIYGKVRNRMESIEVDVEPVSDYWVKITPRQELAPGEYALVEIDAEGAANQLVWDFGVNPDARPSPAAVRPNEEKREPVLIQRPKKKS